MAEDQPSLIALLGGRLALDFANAPSHPGAPERHLSWEELIYFLKVSQIVSHNRSTAILALSRTDPHAAEALLLRATRLRDALREAFAAIARRTHVDPAWVNPINEILRITEGHDELVPLGLGWKLEFVAREGGMDWLLAAIARSAAEILAEGTNAPVRVCANPGCGLFFWDASRSHRRRWCSMAVCGNRSKVASFAKRRAS